MPTLLYGLTLPGDPRPQAVAGVGGSACRALPGEAVVAIVSTVGAKPVADAESVRLHDAVLRAFVKAGATVAAVRFGQVFDDDAACVAEVAERAGRIGALLRAHAGCVEMRLLLPVEAIRVPPAARPPAGGPGRAYLESLRARGEVSPDLSLRPLLGPTVQDERIEGFDAGGEGARGIAFAHLVRREDLPEYREALRGLPALSEARLVGPLPLYSFAEPAP